MALDEEELQSRYSEVRDSEFMGDKADYVNSKIDEFIRAINDEMGYNDGEPLDEDGINYILENIKLSWHLTNAIVKED